jgi:hypothetical protein
VRLRAGILASCSNERGHRAAPPVHYAGKKCTCNLNYPYEEGSADTEAGFGAVVFVWKVRQ